MGRQVNRTAFAHLDTLDVAVVRQVVAMECKHTVPHPSLIRARDLHAFRSRLDANVGALSPGEIRTTCLPASLRRIASTWMQVREHAGIGVIRNDQERWRKVALLDEVIDEAGSDVNQGCNDQDHQAVMVTRLDGRGACGGIRLLVAKSLAT